MKDDKAKSKGYKHWAYVAEPRAEEDTSEDKRAGLVEQHALISSVGKDTWIIDSGLQLKCTMKNC